MTQKYLFFMAALVSMCSFNTQAKPEEPKEVSSPVCATELAPAGKAERAYRASLVRVVDGDTYRLEIDKGLDHKATKFVRLKGWNTPEMYARRTDPGERKAIRLLARKAKRAATKWFKHNQGGDGRIVIITYNNKRGETTYDKYGRILVNVYPGGPGVQRVSLGDHLSTLNLALPYMR